MKFVKMHGLGNDYVYADAFTQELPDDLPGLARQVSVRQTGIGSDGLIALFPCEGADARMRVFNADGSEAKMCGNGIRCVARYLRDAGIVKGDRMTIGTLSGPKTVEIEPDGSVTADMGPAAVLDDEPFDLLGVRLLRVDVGNPHAVAVGFWPSDEEFYQLGPALERHPAFPGRVNVEFVRVDARDEFTMRVWERGSGETMACGSGACASFAAARHLNLVGGACTAHLAGGDLKLAARNGRIYMNGPAVATFSGVWLGAV